MEEDKKILMEQVQFIYNDYYAGIDENLLLKATKNILNQLEKLEREIEVSKKRIDILKSENKNSVTKEKIKDKIKEIQNEFKERTQDNDSFYFDYSNEYAHIEEVLEELLYEEY